MAANPRTLVLEQAYADRMADLQTRTVALVADRYRAINPDNLDASFRRFIPAAAGIITLAQQQAQAATDGFVRQVVRLELGRPYEQVPGDATIPGTTIDGRDLQTALASVPPAVFVTIAQGRAVPLAMARGMHVAARMAATETADAGRRQADHHLVTRPDLFDGWQWVARGTCAACLAMMNNATRPAGPLEAHPGCTCIKSMALKDAQDKAFRKTGRQQFDALTREQQEAIFKSAGEAKAEAIRRGQITLDDLVNTQVSKQWRSMLTEGPLPKYSTKVADDLGAVSRSLYAESAAAEPAVTARLLALAEQVGGDMDAAFIEHGKVLNTLGARLKTLPSIERKITTELNDAAAASVRLDVNTVGAKINDALRYTMTIGDDGYTAAIRTTVDDLMGAGHTLIKEPKNFWTEDGYQGVHYLLKTPEGARYELQFHTPTTLATKSPSHELYEEFRDDLTTAARRLEIDREIKNLWAPVHAAPPPGILDL